MKTDGKLAILGGSAAFAEPLHVGRPSLGNRHAFLQRVEDILDRRWLTNAGQYVREFESRVAEIAGTKHCIACCNGTVALEIASRAMGLRGEVIMPSFTFIATAHSLQWQEITPVFADVRAHDHNLDPEQIERHITPRTTGILGVHLWGRACDTEAVEAVASRHKLQVLYDASHAFGCHHRGKPVGAFGRASVFSFHATKFVNALEGGAIVTDDDELAQKIRLMKNFGFRTYDDVIHVGTNGKMNEMSAAMGLTNIEAMADIIECNRRNYDAYRTSLQDIPGVRFVEFRPEGPFNYQYTIAEVDEDCPVSRDNLIKALWAENILARRYFYPGCHRMEPYRSLFPNSYLWLPETESISRRILVLPTGQTVSEGTVAIIAGLIREIVSNGPEIEQVIAQREQPHA